MDEFANNPENSLTTKIGQRIPFGNLMSTNWVFDHIENKYTLYRRKDYMKKVCESLREHAKKLF